MDPPKVKLHRTKEWSIDQPAHEILPSLPMRVALLGPSGFIFQLPQGVSTDNTMGIVLSQLSMPNAFKSDGRL